MACWYTGGGLSFIRFLRFWLISEVLHQNKKKINCKKKWNFKLKKKKRNKRNKNTSHEQKWGGGLQTNLCPQLLKVWGNVPPLSPFYVLDSHFNFICLPIDHCPPPPTAVYQYLLCRYKHSVYCKWLVDTPEGGGGLSFIRLLRFGWL